MGVQLRAEMLSSNFCKLTKKKKKNAATRKKKAMKAVGSVGKEHMTACWKTTGHLEKARYWHESRL